MNFYVYAIMRKGIAYIGKGRGKRIYYSLKSHMGNGAVFFERDLDEKTALLLERQLIREHQPPDNIHYNVSYNGGSPTSLK